MVSPSAIPTTRPTISDPNAAQLIETKNRAQRDPRANEDKGALTMYLGRKNRS